MKMTILTNSQSRAQGSSTRAAVAGQRAQHFALAVFDLGRPARLGRLEGRLLSVDAATRGGMRRGAAAAEVRRLFVRVC